MSFGVIAMSNKVRFALGIADKKFQTGTSRHFAIIYNKLSLKKQLHQNVTLHLVPDIKMEQSRFTK